MGSADAAGDADAGDELIEVAAVDDVADVDGLDAAGDVDDLDAAGLVRAGELCALPDGKGPSASIAMARNGTVNFMTTLSLFRLRRGSSGTVWAAPSK